MIIHTSSIKKYSKVIASIPDTLISDFVYIDVENQKLYVSNKTTAASLSITIEDINDDENMVFVIPKSSFLHIVNTSPTIHINNKYEYIAGDIHGTFDFNENLLKAFSSISTMFDLNEEYSGVISCDDDMISLLKRAFVYVKPDDSNMSNTGIHIHDALISSSSVFRIYVNKILSDIDTFIPTHVCKFIFDLGTNTVVKVYNKLFLINNEELTIITNGVNSVSHLPINEDKFINMISNIRDNGFSIKFPVDILSFKVDFMMFFAKKNTNNLTKLKYSVEDKKLFFIVDKNETYMNIEIPGLNEDQEINIDLSILKDILNKVISSDQEFITMSFTSSNAMMLIDTIDNEYIVFAKINA